MSETGDDLFIPETETPETARRPFGPHALNGRLWFKFFNGSAVVCNCMREPTTTAIVEMLKEWKNDNG
jgi:hypothetical protein